MVLGDQRGRQLGFPTANLVPLPDLILPAHGVYAGYARVRAGRFPAVANVGTRPTIGDDRPLETQRVDPARRATEQCRSTPDLHPQVHDDPLPLRIDGGIRDLGEGLAEVIGDGSRPEEPRGAAQLEGGIEGGVVGHGSAEARRLSPR